MMHSLAILVLRVAVGATFIMHGSQKVFGAFGGPGIPGFAKFLGSLGVTPPMFWAYVAAYAEFAGGLLVLLGVFSRGAAFLLLAVMCVAAWKIHLSKGFFLSDGGYEFVFVLAAACVALILLGAGKYALIKDL
ncbi:MAG TPA: DoxX family protein [Candidatus Omnitrophota bacterium]|nr:DoxX family protein [Candidatus Omnitrophota bacterium]HRZ14380.1 DoxX family protein [Candidatus Omnitrophota bacterium]